MTSTPTGPSFLSPDGPEPQHFTDARAAVEHLNQLYEAATAFLCDAFNQAMRGHLPGQRVRAFYPEIRITTASYAQVDSRLSFGHVAAPGSHATTVTRPYLFRHYLEQQIGLLLTNHQAPITIGPSDA